MNRPPQSKRDHLRSLVAAKQHWNEPLSEEDKRKGFQGWHERGYLPHFDKPGVVQFITFRLWDSMPASKRGEWEHLLAVETRSNAPRSDARRKHAQELEDYLDRGHGKCHLRDRRIATLVENSLLHHDGKHFRILAWVVMPNHVHVLIEVWETPLKRIVQNWKSIAAVRANQLLRQTGRFWQPDYWDRYMHDAEQALKATRYIENNPVKARLCRLAEEWPFSSARFRDPLTRNLILSNLK